MKRAYKTWAEANKVASNKNKKSKKSSYKVVTRYHVVGKKKGSSLIKILSM